MPDVNGSKEDYVLSKISLRQRELTWLKGHHIPVFWNSNAAR